MVADASDANKAEGEDAGDQQVHFHAETLLVPVALGLRSIDVRLVLVVVTCAVHKTTGAVSADVLSALASRPSPRRLDEQLLQIYKSIFHNKSSLFH